MIYNEIYNLIDMVKEAKAMFPNSAELECLMNDRDFIEMAYFARDYNDETICGLSLSKFKILGITAVSDSAIQRNTILIREVKH
mgnify:CR=1 FL=1